jgi:hypothetical protein
MRIRGLAVWIVAAALVSCREGSEPPLVAEEILRLNEAANQVVFGLDHYVTTEGVRRAHVEADTAFFLEGKPMVDLRVMHVTFFDAEGDTTSILTARAGTYNWNTGDMTAKEDVVVVIPREGRRIETSVLYYDRARDRIWGDQLTRMFEADGTVMEGTAFETNSRMDRIDLTSPRLIRPAAETSREP